MENCRHYLGNNTYGQRQRGAVLMISLIMLMALTVIGVTAMNSATLEEKIAGNVMVQHKVFQAAESAVNAAIEDTTTLSNAINNTGTAVRFNHSLTDPSIVAKADVTFVNRAIPIGYSAGTYWSYNFNVTSDSDIVNANAQIAMAQGVAVVGP